jgi:hypothetical protein
MSLNILDLAERSGITLKQVTAREWQGGPCPCCQDGKDRFCVWPDDGESGLYWCRACDSKGGTIKFCQTLGMNYPDACRAVGEGHRLTGGPASVPRKTAAAVEGPDRAAWSRQAEASAIWCHKQLMRRPDLLAWLEQERGINRATIEAWQIGFNPRPARGDGSKWGFPDGGPGCKDHRRPEPGCRRCGMVWIAAGITLPHMQPDGSITGLKVRQFRPGDGAPEDVTPNAEPSRRYSNVKGGGRQIWSLSQPFTGPVVVVESELDALLLWQDLDLMVQVAALLTSAAKPAALPSGPILFALDFDEAGQKAFAWWSRNHGAKPCPAVRGKDVSDMKRAGVCLKEWLRAGLENLGSLRPDVLNPYAHFTLLAGSDWKEQGEIPDHIWRRSLALGGPVVQWQRHCHDPEARTRFEQEYRALWGIA